MHLVIVEIQAAQAVHCCRVQCCPGTLDEAKTKLRQDYWGPRHEEKITYMLSLFENRPKYIIDSDKYVFDQRTICAKAFYTVFGVGKITFHKYKRHYREGLRLVFHGMVLLGKLLKSLGEPMAHFSYNGCARTDDIIYCIPGSMTCRCINNKLIIMMKMVGCSLNSLGTFHSLWNNNFAIYENS
jgi:hypothetical protein